MFHDFVSAAFPDESYSSGVGQALVIIMYTIFERRLPTLLFHQPILQKLPTPPGRPLGVPLLT